MDAVTTVQHSDCSIKEKLPLRQAFAFCFSISSIPLGCFFKNRLSKLASCILVDVNEITKEIISRFI